MKGDAVQSPLGRKIYEGARIAPSEAEQLFTWDILELGRAADFRRRLVRPENTVGFVFDRIINYTNVCESGCAFCAFHARAGRIDPYTLSIDEICARVEAVASKGASQVMLQGGLHPDFNLRNFVRMVSAVKRRFPAVVLHCFSPAEIVHIANKSAVTVDRALEVLKAAGLDSVPGASDILVDRVRRRVCPKKIDRATWCSVMHALARHGFMSSATMTFGLGETLHERIDHLNTIRTVQDQTGNIRAFIPWSFSRDGTELTGISPSTGLDYLRIVAISRIFLDNLVHIQAGWLTEGLKLAQVALAMGADDMGGVLTEEMVVRATGVSRQMTTQEMIALIRDAGLTPVQRDSAYREIRRFG